MWQGSAADVAMCAMLQISKNARLKELGWRLLLQVNSLSFPSPQTTAPIEQNGKTKGLPPQYVDSHFTLGIFLLRYVIGACLHVIISHLLDYGRVLLSNILL